MTSIGKLWADVPTLLDYDTANIVREYEDELQNRASVHAVWKTGFTQHKHLVFLKFAGTEEDVILILEESDACEYYERMLTDNTECRFIRRKLQVVPGDFTFAQHETVFYEPSNLLSDRPNVPVNRLDTDDPEAAKRYAEEVGDWA